MTKDSGYVSAFYELADLLGIEACPVPPETVWHEEMLPRLRAVFSPAPPPNGASVEQMALALAEHFVALFGAQIDKSGPPNSIHVWLSEPIGFNAINAVRAATERHQP